MRPAAVVGYGEAPWRVVHPGPAPGVDPGPMAVAIRCPAGCHAIRHPDIAVIRVDAPAAVRIEVLIADHVRRNVAGRVRVVVSAVATAGPAIEFVPARRGDDLVVAQAGPGEAIRLARIDDIRRAVAIRFTLPLAHDDRRRVAIGIDVDPVFAGLSKGEGEIRRVDLEQLVGLETAHTDVQGALRQLQLGDPVVEIENGDGGAAVQADHRPADLDLGPRTRLSPQAVAGRQRPVDRGVVPLVLAGRREADAAAHVAQARDPRGWVGAGPAAEDHRKAGHEGKNSKVTRSFLHDGPLWRACRGDWHAIGAVSTERHDTGRDARCLFGSAP